MVCAAFSQHRHFSHGAAGQLLPLLQHKRCAKHTSTAPTLQAHCSALLLPLLLAGRSLAARLPIFQASRCPLAYLWPPGRAAEPYLGAAHGLMGILYVLLHCRQWLQEDAAALQDVQDSLRSAGCAPSLAVGGDSRSSSSLQEACLAGGGY